MTPSARGNDALDREFAAMARCLGIQAVPPDLHERYRLALERLPADLVAADSAALRLARRRTRLMPFLDAGAGLVHPGDPLHRRFLLAAAILETDPSTGLCFLPPADPGPFHLLRLLLVALGAVARLLLGVPLYIVVGTR